MPIASVFMNIADEQIDKVSVLECELANMQSRNGELLSLYTS